MSPRVRRRRKVREIFASTNLIRRAQRVAASIEATTASGQVNDVHFCTDSHRVRNQGEYETPSVRRIARMAAH